MQSRAQREMLAIISLVVQLLKAGVYVEIQVNKGNSKKAVLACGKLVHGTSIKVEIHL